MKYYITDYDDIFDNTYAYFEFEVPEHYAETCKRIAPKEDRLTVGEMFKKECEEMSIPGSPAFKRAERMVEMIFGNGLGEDDGDEGIKFINL